MRVRYRVRRADGTVIWVERVTRAIRDPGKGKIAEFQFSVRDVTETKNAEDEVARQRDGLEELVEERTAELLETIADLVREKKIPDISDIRDESDRKGMRMVIEIKRDGNANVVLNQLYKHTQMETSFGVILLSLVDGRPRILPVREIAIPVHCFLDLMTS